MLQSIVNDLPVSFICALHKVLSGMLIKYD